MTVYIFVSKIKKDNLIQYQLNWYKGLYRHVWTWSYIARQNEHLNSNFLYRHTLYRLDTLINLIIFKRFSNVSNCLEKMKEISSKWGRNN